MPRAFLHSIGIALLASSIAPASILTYSDRATWTGAVTDVVTRDFSGYTTPGTTASFNTSSGLTIAGVQFVGMWNAGANSLEVVEANGSQWWYEWGSGAVLKGDSTSTDRRIVITMPIGSYTFGVDLMTGGINASELQIRINGAETYNVTTQARPGRQFFGAVSTDVISTIEVLYPTAGIYPMLDNFSTANAGAPVSETPEAATLLLAAAGLIYIARRSRNTAPALG